MQDGEVWLTQDGELAEKETRAKFTQVADNGKPINIIQDKNYQSDFDRLMADEYHPCFELFYRNTGGFLCGKP